MNKNKSKLLICVFIFSNFYCQDVKIVRKSFYDFFRNTNIKNIQKPTDANKQVFPCAKFNNYFISFWCRKDSEGLRIFIRDSIKKDVVEVPNFHVTNYDGLYTRYNKNLLISFFNRVDSQNAETGFIELSADKKIVKRKFLLTNELIWGLNVTNDMISLVTRPFKYKFNWLFLFSRGHTWLFKFIENIKSIEYTLDKEFNVIDKKINKI